MQPYLLVLGLGVAALVQTSLLPPLAVAGVTPDLTLVLVVGWALLRGARSAALWALIAGLWLDLLSGGPFGMYTLGLLAAAAVAGLGGGTVFRSHLILPIVMVVVATLVQGAVQLLLLALVGDGVVLTGSLVRLLLLELVYNSVVTLLVFPVLAWLSRVTGQERLPLE
jgi:rod shape-determining protein MreD